MTFEINPEMHGQDLRVSCLADWLEFQAFKGMMAFTEADLADYISDSDWQRILEPKYIGGEWNDNRIGDRQDKSREAAGRVLNILAQRKNLLEGKYPFELRRGRLALKQGEGKVYLWYLFVSLVHGLGLRGIPAPAIEFERAVTVGLCDLGLPALTVGTSAQNYDFGSRIQDITCKFPHLVETLDDVVRSRHLNDGGIDTFASFPCAMDTRHGHWAFIGQSTVGKSDDWSRKIHEVKPNFWHQVFGQRIEPIAFFATPHHIQDDYLNALFQDHRRCLLDRIRLTLWTSQPPPSFQAYETALHAVIML